MELDEHLKTLVEEALGTTIIEAEVIGGGRNSRVFRVTGEHDTFVLKHYPDLHRLQAESNAFRFLQAQDISQVPTTLLVDEENHMAAYAFIDGVEVGGENLDQRDIDDCVRFIEALHMAGKNEDSKAFGPAAEAFFRLSDIESNLSLRLERLEQRERTSEQDDALTAFLDDEFLPAKERIVQRARNLYTTLGIEVDQPLAEAYRCLSPSDFGFHNALRTSDGMVFCDFEYFGWDDPAKLVADFILHPGMDISIESRMRFAKGIVDAMDESTLQRRIDALLPLFGLKWCMILLNEFLRSDMERREFAGATESRQTVLERQLVKARSMMKTTRNFADNGFDL